MRLLSSKRFQRGFSLIETAFALGFFTVGITALVSLQTASFYAVQASSDLSMATSLASGRLEELLVEDLRDISGPHVETYDIFGNLLAGDAAGDPSVVAYTLTWVGTVFADEPFVLFDVRVTWFANNNPSFEHAVETHGRRYLRN